MPPVDIAPLMDHPGWKTITAAQRQKALEYWQDPSATESDRAEMRAEMDRWAAEAAQQPSAPASMVRTAGSILQDAPGWVNRNMGVLGRADRQDPNAPPAPAPQTPQEFEARTLPMQQQLAEGANAIPGLMAGPAWGKAGYKAGETILSKLTPSLVNRPMTQTVANALPATFEAGGNYLSRQANVAMGVEQPGVVGDVTALALPLAVRGATSAPVARRLPGSAVAQHEIAAEDVRRGAERMQPSTPSDTLYRAVGQHQNPAIDINDLRQTSRDLIKQHTARGDATRDTRVLALAKELDDLGTHYGNKVPLNVLYDRMKAVGEMTEEAQSKGGRSATEFSNIYARFHGALENAVQQQVPGAETLQQAIHASRQEHAVKRLQKIIGQDMGEGRGIATQDATGYTFVRGKYMLNQFERALADDEVFKGSFTAGEIDDMRQLFQGASELPKLPVPGSAAKGAGQWAARTGIGTGIGYALAGPEGAAVGGSIAGSAPEIIAKAMMHPRGREYLKAALEGRGGIRPETLAVINEAIRVVPETYTSKRPSTTP